MSNVTVIKKPDSGWKDCYPIKFWSDAFGNLYDPHHSGESIVEDRLPVSLQYAYKQNWEENAGGCYTYLAEFEMGYGIALIAEYDEQYAETCGFSMAEMFNFVERDAKLLSAAEALWCADIFVLEKTGLRDAHQLVVFLPASYPHRDFVKAAEWIEKKVYHTPNTLSLQKRITAAVIAAHQDVGDYDVRIHRIRAVGDDRFDVELSYKWKLNSWEKNVTKTDFVVRDSFGFWNIVCSMSPLGRFKSITP